MEWTPEGFVLAVERAHPDGGIQYEMLRCDAYRKN